MENSNTLTYGRSYMLQVYNYMTLALLLTGIVAIFTVSSEIMMSLIYTIHDKQITGFTPLGWLVALSPIAIVLMFSFSLPKMNVFTAQVLFWIYSGLMGLSLSSVFLIYTGRSIANIFFITAIIFGFMSLYGYTAKRDLTSLGSFLIMGLLGIIVASLVNLFFKSTVLNFALSILSVVICTGLTAFDIQRIKAIYNIYGVSDEKMAAKIAIIGALTLYLDFINIFVHLLHLFGKRKQEFS